METLALILAAGVLGFVGFKFYQNRRRPSDISIEKADPDSFKLPDPAQPSSAPEPASLVVDTPPEKPFMGFPKSPEPVAEPSGKLTSKARKPRAPKSTTASAKKPKKTQAV